MASRDYAIRPKTILKHLRRIAPNVEIDIEWTPDYTFQWDGDGPDPAESGYIAYDVDVSVVLSDEDEKVLARGDSHLGGFYAYPGEEDPYIGGYFTQMLEEALLEAAEDLAGGQPPLNRGRKNWNPRQEKDGYMDQLTDAWAFVKRSSRAIYERQRRRMSS